MDPITIWTALGVLVVAGGGVIGLIRKGDTDRIQGIEKQMDAITTQVTEKAHKDEVARIEARMDREFQAVRSEQRDGFADLKQDIKDMRQDLMLAIKDAVKQ